MGNQMMKFIAKRRAIREKRMQSKLWKTFSTEISFCRKTFSWKFQNISWKIDNDHCFFLWLCKLDSDSLLYGFIILNPKYLSEGCWTIFISSARFSWNFSNPNSIYLLRSFTFSYLSLKCYQCYLLLKMSC